MSGRSEIAIPTKSILIDAATLCAVYGLSLDTVSRLVADHLLPEPVRSGTRNHKRYWLRDEIDAAIAAWPRGRAS
jgi:predicted DNA-binding transcriptional regulator AlpA